MKDNITVLGIGSILYSDDGVGIRVVEKLLDTYEFSENVTIVDGGVLGINLLGIISNAGKLIVVDTVFNKGNPGDLHRLEHDEIPKIGGYTWWLAWLMKLTTPLELSSARRMLPAEVYASLETKRSHSSELWK